MTSGGTLTIASGGTLANGISTFTRGSGTVAFAGTGTVTGTIGFNNVTLAGGVNFGTASTVHGNLTINAGGFVNTNAPTYGSSSSLIYNTGVTFGRGIEWSATSGAGYPNNITVNSGSGLDLGNGGTGTMRQIAGNLILNGGLYMDFSSNDMTQALRVLGDLTIGSSGQLSLSEAVGGDIYVSGNWTRSSGGIFNPNGRAVFFTGNANSTINGSGGETFTYMVNEKTGGSISLGNNLTLTAPNGGNALTHKSTASIDLNNYSLTFSGPDNSNVLADGACSITGTGNVFITSNSKNLTRQNSGSWTFGSNVLLRLQSGLNFGTNISTVNGTLEINSGGFVTGNGPSYGIGSTLKYNTGNSYGRNTEWLSAYSSGAGVPYNVLISAETTLDPGANSNASYQSWVRNELTIDGTFDMSLTDQVEPINVLGNVTFNNGTLKLSTTAGGDIKVGGNWSGTGTFTPNSRAVYINGTGNQTISRNDIFPFLIIDKASGTLTIAGNITLNNKLTYSGGSISFSGGSIDASGASAEVEFANSSAFTLPTGLFSGNVNNLTLNGTGGVNLSENLTVIGNLTLTNGDLNIGANTLTLGSASTLISGSSTSHVNATSTGEIRKIYGSNGTYTFPVGDGTNYTPVTLNFTGGSSISGASDDYVGVRLKTSKVTDMNSANTTFLNRSWFIEPGAGLSGYTYTVNLKYADVDVNGTESNIKPVKKSSGVWHYPGDASFEYGTQLTGTSTSGTDYNANVLVWSGLTSFSEFGGGGQGGPLPVELTSFSASCEQDLVTLSWSTASEQNSSHFDVEKSIDGENWRVIGTISAAGNSTQDIHYSFVDSEKSIDQNYYRLNQVDIDGKNEYFGPITVACEENTKINTYPNPSKGEFNLVIHSKTNEKVTFKITDGNSRVISTKVLDLQNGINLFPIRENLSSGVYHIQLITESGKTTVLKHSVY
jgi:hypothetical protein